jgi:hypothetical protein
MGTLKVDTVVGSDGTSPVTLTKQSAAKAWNFFDGSAGTIAFADSFNSSTLVDSGVGNYKYAFINSMSNADFSFGGAAIIDETTFGLLTGTEIAGSHARSTSSSGGFWITNAASINSSADANSISTQIFGDLA